ncbi:MAG: polysaccharide deacetylase family protein [Lachnospiraceae bacterium]|nr:polysaccharide deacetylase family protein [Lachnospiraceae bacterium]
MAYKKYVSFSFDDGLEQDKKIIRILKEYGLRGATFNLNGGLMGQKRAIAYIGEIGFAEKENLELLDKNGRFIKYAPAFRIPSDEIAQVYEDFEVASHGYLHENMKKLNPEMVRQSVEQDIRTLQKLTGKKIRGFAYPFGAVSDEAVEELKKLGIVYARTITAAKDYSLPKDPMHLAPTYWMPQKKTEEALKYFLKAPITQEDQLFYMWGHGYELDFKTENSSWDRFRRICSMIAQSENVICCTNSEIFSDISQ